AQIAIVDAERSQDAATLSNAVKSNEENQQQTWDRIIGPSENFAPDMANDFADFKKRYALWKDGNKMATDRALQIGPQALSFILNADRDAYQAYVAVLIIDRAQNDGELKAQVESY
ncbi:hypothetical protein ADUPG1_003651, partial [Aduncisulcus paluster]